MTTVFSRMRKVRRFSLRRRSRVSSAVRVFSQNFSRPRTLSCVELAASTETVTRQGLASATRSMRDWSSQ